jgi:hypothetical protein
MPKFETPNSSQEEKKMSKEVPSHEASSIDAHAGKAESDHVPVRLKISNIPSCDSPPNQPIVRTIMKGLQSFTDASESEIEEALFRSREGTFTLRSDNSMKPEKYVQLLEKLHCTVEILPAS